MTLVDSLVDRLVDRQLWLLRISMLHVRAGKGATGIYILIVMAVALATYIAWRFWEAITGQVPCSAP